MVDAEKIKKEGVKLLEEFSEVLKDVPETSETHYVVDLKNVQRSDDTPEVKKGFQDKIKSFMDKAPAAKPYKVLPAFFEVLFFWPGIFASRGDRNPVDWFASESICVYGEVVSKNSC